MSVKYKSVKRKDHSKGAAKDAQKFYASVNNSGTLDFKQMCDSISAFSTASRGDVLLVLDGDNRETYRRSLVSISETILAIIQLVTI